MCRVFTVLSKNTYPVFIFDVIQLVTISYSYYVNEENTKYSPERDHIKYGTAWPSSIDIIHWYSLLTEILLNIGHGYTLYL